MTKYECPICLRQYEDEIFTEACKNSGIAVPEYKRYEVIHIYNYKGVDSKMTPIVGEVLNHLSFLSLVNPHKLPFFYNIRTVWPSESGVFPRDLILKRRPNVQKDYCPFCKLTDIKKVKEKKYEPYPFLSQCFDYKLEITNLEISQCNDCGKKFFSSKQSQLVDKKINTMFQAKHIKTADTKKLIRRNWFDYPEPLLNMSVLY